MISSSCQFWRKTIFVTLQQSCAFEKCACVPKVLQVWVFRSTITYLWNAVKPRKLKSEDCAISSLKEALFTSEKRYLGSFFGFCSVYCCFIHIFAHIASPLNDMKGKQFPKAFDDFSVKQTGSFEELIKLLTSTLIWQLPRTQELYLIDTDASDYPMNCPYFKLVQGIFFS